MITIKKIIDLLTGKRSLCKELAKEKKKVMKLRNTIHNLLEENEFLKSTINEFAIDSINRKNVADGLYRNFVVNKGEMDESARKNVAIASENQGDLSCEHGFQDYQPVEPEDEVYKKMLEACNPENLGIGSKLESGEPIVYKSLTEEEMCQTLDYIKSNQKEQELTLNDTTKVVIAGHTDNSVSASFYDDEGHLRSISTAENERAKMYSEEELMDVIKFYSKGED